MKKAFKALISFALAAYMAISLAACGGNSLDNQEESKICEVKAVVAGYDVDWLYEAAEVFNQMYAEEGYEVKITLTDTEINAPNEISTPNRNTTDLYFEYDNIDSLINKSKSILKKNGVSLLEDLTDVFNSKAIGIDKKEQGEKTIGERMDPRTRYNASYHGRLSGFDGIYALPYQGGTNGIYVNKKALEQRGYSLDDLLTTNGLLKVVYELAPTGKPGDPGYANQFFPVAWAGLNAPGYWDYLYSVLVAQYTGAEKYENIWNFIPDEGEEKLVEKGYTVYEERGLLEALKVIEALENTDLCAPGTSSMRHTAAQARVFNGTSLFMVSGDWIYKEMEKDYSEYLDDVVPIRAPMISALGVKLGLCGKTHQEGASCDDCEGKLKQIIKLVDGGEKSDEEIAAETGVPKEKVAVIRERRGYINGGTLNPCVFIPSYSNAKTVAKLFLRFIYSDDCHEIYRAHTYSYMSIKHNTPPDRSKMSENERFMYDRLFSSNTKIVYKNEKNVIRLRNSIAFFPQQGSIVAAFQGLAYSHKYGTPLYTAQSIYEGNIEYARRSWTDWIYNAGLVR